MCAERPHTFNFLDDAAGEIRSYFENGHPLLDRSYLVAALSPKTTHNGTYGALSTVHNAGYGRLGRSRGRFCSQG